MATAQELFNKGEDLWVKSFQLNDADKRKTLLMAVSFIQQAIATGQSTPYMYAIQSRVLHLLAGLEGKMDLVLKARQHAETALQRDTNIFDAHYTLYLIAMEEFDAKGGFNAKAKSNVNLGWLAIGALLNPEAAGRAIGDHYGKKVVDKAASREAGQRLYTAFAGMVQSFSWALHYNANPGTIEYYSRVIMLCAESMDAAGYPMKQVYQTIVEGLSRFSNGGEFENQIRETQAQAQGALMLL